MLTYINSVDSRQNMTDFMVSFHDWDAAEDKERREYEKKEMQHKEEVTPEEFNNLEDNKDAFLH